MPTQKIAEVTQVIVGRDIEDLRKYGTSGTIYIGKHLAGTGEDAHVTTPVLMDVLRPHMIVLCGKRGTGKCLMPNTDIFMLDGSKKTIEEIFKIIKEPDDSKEEEVVKCNKLINVLTLDQNDLRLKAKAISHVYRKKVNEKLLKIVTRRGKEIICTKEHPLLVLERNMIWRMAGELKENSLVGVLSSASNVGYSLLFSLSLAWDRVQKIEEIDYDGYVYDLTVPETHNFVAGANGGIICHNSYSMGVFAEEIKKLPESVGRGLSVLFIDTQGIFWTMKSPNEKDAILLKEWSIEPKGFDTFVYVPEGQKDIFENAGVEFDDVFSVAPSELSAEDWFGVFELDPNQPLGILLQRTINKLKKERGNYTLGDIVSEIRKQQGFESERLALENRFEAAKGWGIFGASKMPEILEPNKFSILDVSLTPQTVRALLVGIVSRKIFIERTIARRKEELAETSGAIIKRVPLCWIFIDEAHNFIPDVGKPASMDILQRLTREGRQPGITLVLATQRPDKLHPDALAQTDFIISHRLTTKADIDALRSIMQTYMLYDIAKYLNDLPKLKGTAIILDDNSERIYTVRIRPRQSWHAGASPVAMV